MAKEPKGESQELNAWMLLQQTRDLIFRCEDRVLNRCGLTTEQYEVLLAIKYLDEPVRATDIGRWLGHKVNTVSMIVERMVKAGLVDRMRDLPDRREVRVAITAKGEQAFTSGSPAVSELIETIWSSLPSDDAHTLFRLLEVLRDRALDCASTGADIRGTESY